MDDELARQMVAVNQAWLGLGAEVFEAAGATFARDRTVPLIRDSNHAGNITAATPAEIDALFARADVEFAFAPHRRFDVTFLTPPGVEARLSLDGFSCDETLMMVLEGDVAGADRPFDIRPVDDDEAWRQFFALEREDWLEYRTRLGQEPEVEVGDMMAAVRGRKCPPVQYFIAYDEEVAAGYFSSWGGFGGIGQVEDLFVLKEHRHRGIATALVRRCVADSRAKGAGPVFLGCDPTDTPKEMYRAMGFRPIAMKRSYRRVVGTGD